MSLDALSSDALSSDALRPDALRPDTVAHLLMPSGPWVKIVVKDSGIGIDPQHLHKLFKPFVMVDGSRTRAYEGTGLGLAISQNFMRLMGGDITLRSDGNGCGTEVIIVVPRLVLAQMNRGVAHSPASTLPSMKAATLSERN